MRVQSHLMSKRTQIGFSLIELMVVVVITLLMSLAVFGVLSTSESKKRTATSVNDIDQAGAYAMYVMEKQIRSAGSGLHGGSATDYGCQLEASLNGTAILPTTAASLPAEFNKLTFGAAPASSFRGRADRGCVWRRPRPLRISLERQQRKVPTS